MAVGHLLSALPPLRGDSVFCPKLHRKRDVPKSPIIATGSTGAMRGHDGFIVHTLSVQARIALGRGEGNMKLPHRRQFLHLAAGAAALPVASRFALAQPYPARPVRILVGFAAGGNFDIVARLIGQWLSDQLHQPVIVENRPGASSNLATEAVIRAPADGYTLLLGGAVNAVNATLYEKLNFNFISDVAPVAGVSRFPNVDGRCFFSGEDGSRIYRLRES
jgi:hypothetical protein